MLANPRRDIVPRHFARHHDVTEHEGNRFTEFKKFDRLGSCPRLEGSIAECFQPPHRCLPDFVIVLDNQDALAIAKGRFPGSDGCRDVMRPHSALGKYR